MTIGRMAGAKVRAHARASLFAFVAALVLVGLVDLVLAGSALGAAGTAPPPTRADLAALRSRVALLESELALARTRKPYVVVDAAAKRLRYSLLGMTLREIAARDITIEGVRRDERRQTAPSPSLAGIMTLQGKEKDPRHDPLTPEQIEGGAADENVADALPPEIPGDYDLTFKQPIVVRVEGEPDGGAVLPRASSFWRGLWPGWWGGGREALRVVIRLDQSAAREVYRSLLPGERLIVLPAPGRLLPDVGQEAARSIRPGKPAKPPTVQPPGAPQPGGVPFRIPEPVAATPPGAAPPGGGEGIFEEPDNPAVESPAPTPGDGPGTEATPPPEAPGPSETPVPTAPPS